MPVLSRKLHFGLTIHGSGEVIGWLAGWLASLQVLALQHVTFVPSLTFSIPLLSFRPKKKLLVEPKLFGTFSLSLSSTHSRRQPS